MNLRIIWIIVLLGAAGPFTRAAQSAEFIPLPFESNGVSEDGLVVALEFSSAERREAYQWTEDTGAVNLGHLPGSTKSGFDTDSPSVSGDGSTIVGKSEPGFQQRAFLHTVDSGMQALGGSIVSEASAVSFDGDVVVGKVGSPWHAFRWTESEGIVDLGTLPNASGSTASDVSADGSIVVGFAFDSVNDSNYEVFRWSAETGMTALGIDMLFGSAEPRISADGQLIGGAGLISSTSNLEAFLYAEDTGVQGLGWLPGTEDDDGTNGSFITGITGFGAAVGYSGKSRSRRRGVVWSQTTGMLDFKQVLTDQHGLGEALEGWTLRAPIDISADGRFITGNGYNPSGDNTGWLVRLEKPILPVPEPSTLLLLLIATIPLITNRRQVLGRFSASCLLTISAASMTTSHAAEFVQIGTGLGTSGVSADGSVVVGWAHNAEDEAYLWSKDRGLQMLGVLDGHTNSRARGASADGSVVVGWSQAADGRSEIFLWTEENGISGIGNLMGSVSTDNYPAISDDGSTVVGTAFFEEAGARAFRWTTERGFQTLLPDGRTSSYAHGISADGETVAVEASDTDFGSDAAGFRWDPEDGFHSLGAKPGGFESVAPWVVSSDGKVIAGDDRPSHTSGRAFRWTDEEGIRPLAGLSYARVFDLNPNGSIAVGVDLASGQEAFIWDELNGTRGLRETLIAEHGFTNQELPTLEVATGISADAMTIVGMNFPFESDPADRFAWAIYLDKPLVPIAVPEPSTTILLCIATALLGWHRRRTVVRR